MTFAEFASLAESKGLKARACGSGHWQITGALRPVNYYPNTGTIYVNGQHKARQWGKAELAIEVALVGPAKMPKGRWSTNSRRKRAAKRRMLANDPTCSICSKHVDEKDATVDHVVPLALGGSNRRDNLALAHETCNKQRGYKWAAEPPGGLNALDTKK